MPIFFLSLILILVHPNASALTNPVILASCSEILATVKGPSIWNSARDSSRQRREIILTAMAQGAKLYKNEKAIFDPFIAAFGAQADEKFSQAFFNGFSKLDGSSVYIVHFGKNQRVYEPQFFSEVVPTILRPKYPIAIPDIEGTARLSFKTRNKPAWLPGEIDEGYEIYNLNTPEYSKYDAVVEISRVSGFKLNRPIENVQFYSSVFQPIVEHLSHYDPHRVLVTVAAHSDAHEGLWGSWSFEAKKRSRFIFQGHDISPNIHMNTTLENVIKIQNEKTAVQVERFQNKLPKTRSSEVLGQRNGPVSFIHQNFPKGVIDVQFVPSEDGHSTRPEFLLKRNGADRPLKADSMKASFQILDVPYDGDMYDNNTIVLGYSVLGDWGRGVRDIDVHPLRVSKLTITRRFKELGNEDVSTEVYFLHFQGTLEFYRGQEYSDGPSSEDTRAWADFDLLSGDIASDYKPFGHFSDRENNPQDTTYFNREKLTLPIRNAILFPWMTANSRMHTGMWTGFFQNYRSKISFGAETYLVHPQESLPLPYAFYNDGHFLEGSLSQNSISSLIKKYSIAVKQEPHGPQPPAVPGPFLKAYEFVFAHQNDLLKVLESTGLKNVDP